MYRNRKHNRPKRQRIYSNNNNNNNNSRMWSIESSAKLKCSFAYSFNLHFEIHRLSWRGIQLDFRRRRNVLCWAKYSVKKINFVPNNLSARKLRIFKMVSEFRVNFHYAKVIIKLNTFIDFFDSHSKQIKCSMFILWQ